MPFLATVFRPSCGRPKKARSSWRNRQRSGSGGRKRKPWSMRGVSGRARRAHRHANIASAEDRCSVPILDFYVKVHYSTKSGGNRPRNQKRRLPMAASKSELLDKLRTSRNEIVSKPPAIPPDALEQGRYESGWNGRQILAHIASMEWSYPRLIDVAREAQSPRPAEASKEASTEPASRPARGGINDYNERQGAKRAHMSGDELIGEFETKRAATTAAFAQADEARLHPPPPP